jgi:hypothetical protein
MKSNGKLDKKSIANRPPLRYDFEISFGSQISSPVLWCIIVVLKLSTISSMNSMSIIKSTATAAGCSAYGGLKVTYIGMLNEL